MGRLNLWLQWDGIYGFYVYCHLPLHLIIYPRLSARKRAVIPVFICVWLLFSTQRKPRKTASFFLGFNGVNCLLLLWLSGSV
jgi:hypothetical protein